MPRADPASRFVTRAGLALLLLVAACSRGGEQPGTVSADDQRQLNEAAATLDANIVDAKVLPAPGTGTTPTQKSQAQ